MPRSVAVVDPGFNASQRLRLDLWVAHRLSPGFHKLASYPPISSFAMKIAVSSQDKAHVTGHLGRCQRFWVYDLEGDNIQGKELFQLTKDQSFHESSPQVAHPLDGVQVLISGGMGRGLARRLESKGILPVITPETDPDVAIAAYTAGTLAITALEDHVHHHDHDHDHGHQHDHGDGEGCGCSSAS